MSSSKGKFRREEGDWQCPDPKCGNYNFSKRTKCNRCGAKPEPKSSSSSSGKDLPPVEIGEAAAEKSRGLFAADDWQCKMCGNVNWARRSNCNICNAPKMGKIEERTGYGGGFMEREENVQYKEKKVEDDEYDEFGRKKKGFRKTEERKEEKRKERSPTPNEEQEEEEEDDEDEDGDISAYKLDSDDEDEEEAKNDKNNHDKNNSKGRSRSSSRSRSRSRSSSSSSSSSSSGSRKGRKRSYSRSRSRSSSRERKSRRSSSGDRAKH